MMPGGQVSPSSGGAFPGPDGDGQPSADELFGTRPVATPDDIRDELRRQMGEDVRRAVHPPDHPDVHRLAEQLGLA